MSTQLDAEVQAVLLEVDKAIGAVGDALQRTAKFVDEGRLDPGIVMAKFGELSARLMGGGQ